MKTTYAWLVQNEYIASDGWSKNVYTRVGPKYRNLGVELDSGS